MWPWASLASRSPGSRSKQSLICRVAGRGRLHDRCPAACPPLADVDDLGPEADVLPARAGDLLAAQAIQEQQHECRDGGSSIAAWGRRGLPFVVWRGTTPNSPTGTD